jgi:hypothetical protein
MPVRKPSDRYCYAIQQRRYVWNNEVGYGSRVLWEFTRAEWRDIEALQGPVLDDYRRISGQEAHDFVRRGGIHNTGLWTDNGDPMEEAA